MLNAVSFDLKHVTLCQNRKKNDKFPLSVECFPPLSFGALLLFTCKVRSLVQNSFSFPDSSNNLKWSSSSRQLSRSLSLKVIEEMTTSVQRNCLFHYKPPGWGEWGSQLFLGNTLESCQTASVKLVKVNQGQAGRRKKVP